jgi:LacI family transcriptional regulator
MITLKDLAQELQLSVSTISRALSGNHDIGPATIKRVQALAQQMGYQPNSAAVSLRKGKTNTLGVITPHLANNFFGQIVTGIEAAANKAGYRLLVCQSNDDAAREGQNIEMLLNAQVSGILLSQARTTQQLPYLAAVHQRKTPLVFFDRFLESYEGSAVMVDDYAGGYQATQHLVAQGYRRIAHLAGPSQLNNYKNRRRGYEEALRVHGLPVEESLILTSPVRIEDGLAGMQQLLALPQPPDAVFSASDFAALGCLQVLKERRMRVPEEIGIVGFSNELFGQYTEPALTSVDQHGEQMGQAAAQLLLQLIAGKVAGATQHVVLAPALLERASSLRQH